MINEVLGMTVDVSATTDKFVSDLQKAAKKANLNFNVADPLIKSFKTAQTSIKGQFAQTIADGASAGLGRARLDGFIRKLQPLTDSIESSMKKVFETEVKIRKAGLDDAAKQQLKAALAEERQRLYGLQTRLKMERVATDRIVQRRKEAIQEAERLAARTMSEAGEEFSESVGKAFEDLKSGNVADILKGLGKGAGARGALLGERGAAAGGMKGSVLQGLGGLLKSLGPMLLAVGALAAGIAAVAKVIVDADAKAKELNKSLLDAGVTVGELNDQLGEATGNLDLLRQTFQTSRAAFDFNRLWGTTAKDHMEILGAYAQAGLTFKELRSSASTAGNEMEKLQAATAATLTYAKLLGSTNVEMAEIFATQMEEMGQNIDGVSKSLSAVHMAARESGFGVKRFFNMVLQATTGMTMYNVRMEEAAGLLTRLGKILGAKTGGEFLQGLTKGYGDEGTQDKYKRVMLTGSGRTKAVFQRSAENTAADFIGKVADQKMGPMLRSVLKDSGLKLDMSSEKTLVRDLQAMTGQQQTSLLAVARRAGNDELVQQLTNLVGAAQGAKGGTGNMAMNLGSLDMGGKLMMQLQQGMAVLGKPLHELGLTETMAFENMTGVQGEQLMQLKRVSQALYGNWGELKKLQAANKDYSEAEKLAQAQAYGAIVEGNKVFAARIDANTNEVVKGRELSNDVGSYIQTQGEVFKEAAAASLSADTKLAQEQVAATTEMSKILEQGVEWLLGQINDSVGGILALLTGGLDAEERENKRQLVTSLMEGVSSLREQEKSAAKKWSEAKARAVAATGADKTKAEEDMASAAAAQKGIRIKMAEELAVLERAKRLNQGFGVGSYNRAELEAQARARVTSADRAQAMGKAGLPSEDIEAQKKQVDAAKWAVINRRRREAGLADAAPGVSGVAALKELETRLGDQAAIRQMQQPGSASAKQFGKAEIKKVVSEMTAAGNAASKNLLTKKGPNSPAGVAAEETAKAMKDPLTKAFDANRQKEKEDDALAQLQGILGSAGVTGVSPAEMSQWATDIAAGRGAPKGLQALYGRKGSGEGAKTVLEQLQERLPAASTAHDFIMQVGAGGRVKFAQRIDSGDTVTAAKPGGAIDQAARGGGRGGVTIVQHNYSGTEAIQKGYRALMAARAI